MTRANSLFFFRSLLLEALLLFVLYSPNPAWSAPLTLAFGVYAAFALSTCVLDRAGRLPEALSLGSFFVDIAASSIILHISRTVDSHFLIAYFLIIMASSLMERLVWSFAVGGVACIVYSALAYPSLGQALETPRLLGLSVLLTISFFSASIVHYIKRSQQETAARYEKKIAWMERLSSLGNALTAVLHDIKTPLNAISLSAEYLSGVPAFGRNGKISRSLDAIRKESDKALDVVQDYLDFLRPSLIRRGDLDIGSILSNLLSSGKEKFSDLGIHASFSPGPPCRVFANSRQLERAFDNILRNALEAMPDGGRLGVSVGSAEGRAVVAIKDDGAGMAPEEVSRLFDSPESASPKGAGRGLGFAVARWIILKHGGELSVESERGRGTTVRIMLPLSAKRPEKRA